jgi:hypothetical protein
MYNIMSKVCYIVDHMTYSNAKQNSQICWHKDIMNSAFKYALDNLETSSHDNYNKYATIVTNRVNEDIAGIG